MSHIFVKGINQGKVCGVSTSNINNLDAWEVRCGGCKSKSKNHRDISKIRAIYLSTVTVAPENVTTVPEELITEITHLPNTTSVVTSVVTNNHYDLRWAHLVLCSILNIEKFDHKCVITPYSQNKHLNIINGVALLNYKDTLVVSLTKHITAKGSFYLGSIVKKYCKGDTAINILKIYAHNKYYGVHSINKGEPIFTDIVNNKKFRITEPYLFEFDIINHTDIKFINENIDNAEAPDLEDCKNPCLFCLSKPKIYAFYPCGHLSACEDCKPKLTSLNKCPTCRLEIKGVIRIFN